MKDVSAVGLILRTHPLTETSLIVHWLTEAHGRIATVAKGARRPRSPFSGKLDFGYLARFNFARSRRSDLHTLREVVLIDPHPVLRRDLHALRQAAYATRLLERLTEPEAPVPELFAHLKAFLHFLDAHSPVPIGVFSLELRVLDAAGLAPDLARSHLSPGARAVLEAVVRLDWDQLPTLRLSSRQVSEIDSFLQGFLQFHVERLPASRKAATHPGEAPKEASPGDETRNPLRAPERSISAADKTSGPPTS